MPRPIQRHGSQNSGAGAKCINIVLFITTLGFVLASIIHINDLNNKNDWKDNPDDDTSEQIDYTFMIHCQASVLVWILVQFINYYLFYFLSYLILKMSADSPRVRTRRFKVAIMMSALVVPFMVSWNMYGNVMIHQEYFRI